MKTTFRDCLWQCNSAEGKISVFLVETIMHLLVFNLVILNIYYTSRSTVMVIEWKPSVFK